MYATFYLDLRMISKGFAHIKQLGNKKHTAAVKTPLAPVCDCCMSGMTSPENTMTAVLSGALYTYGLTLNRSVATSSSPSLTCGA
jgi:hypothetical protein